MPSPVEAAAERGGAVHVPADKGDEQVHHKVVQGVAAGRTVHKVLQKAGHVHACGTARQEGGSWVQVVSGFGCGIIKGVRYRLRLDG